MTTHERLFDYTQAFAHPVTVAIVAGIVFLLACAAPVLLLMARKAPKDLQKELWARYFSWLAIAPAMIIPVLLGACWTILIIGLMSLACYGEYARATGLFRDRLLSAIAAIGILVTFFAVADHWYGLFVAIPPFMLATLAAAAIFKDQPRGYIQRVGLGVFGYMLIGSSFGHLAYFANDESYRPMILGLVLCVQINDIFAFTCGKLFGKRKLAIHTSPNKTIEGAIGAIFCTTALTCLLGWIGLRGTAMASLWHLPVLGLILSIGGILGDLVISSVKRDIGVKDMGALIPGHGGLLDRCNSLILVAPALFYYVAHFRGVGDNQATRILTAGGF